MFQDLLDVADSLNKGVSSVSESEISSSPSLATVHEGLKLCESQLLQVVSCIYVHALLKFINKYFDKVFSKHGLVQENPLGEKFDPNKHDALFQVKK